jgi:dipeptidyl aminopeptidase/acylaminoacyl peptidase
LSRSLRAPRVFKLAILSLAALAVLGIAVLAIIGLPKPPAITEEGVGRIGWSPILKNFGEIRRGLRSRSLGAWLPGGRGLTATAPRRFVDFRLHVVSGPGRAPQLAKSLPRNVAGFYTDLDRPYAVFRSDAGGNEQYQLYLWDFEDSEPVRLTSGDERAAFGAFEPGGVRIAYTSTRRNGSDSDIYVMDPLHPDSDRRVLERTGSWFVSDWSPVAEELLLVRTISNVENELYRFDLASEEVTQVTDSAGSPTRSVAAQYSRDGQALYYASDRDTEFRHLRRRELHTGQQSVLSAAIPWDVTSIQQSGDGHTLVVGVNEDGRTRYYLHDVGTTAVNRLELPLSGIYSVRLHPTLPLLRINHVDPLGVGRGYVYDMESQELTLWIGAEPEEAEVPEARLVRYPTFDSVAGEARTISAFVYPGVGEGPRSVLVEIHGGPEAQSMLTTAYHLPQTLGVTVITPNVHGSTGYGRTFTTLDDGFRREDPVRDIGALLDWIERQPDLDSRRVMVSGGSYGGYMVLASLVHFGDRLRCGIDIVGISHFVTFLENTADYRRDLRRPEYGDERDPVMRAFLDSISPLIHADRIRSRIMILQGANDPRVPVSESRQFVERLRANGLDVAYLEAANEGHGFVNPWNSIYSGMAQMGMALDCLVPDVAG